MAGSRLARKWKLKLPPNKSLALPRPDLSAQEALALILGNAGEILRQQPIWVLATAGGANKRGRLIEPFAWELRLFAIEPDRYVQVFLSFTGQLTFAYQKLQVSLPVAADLTRSWIDSTAAADSILPEPLPAGLTDRYTLFCSLGAHDQHGIVWNVDRISQDPTTNMMVRHKFLLNAETKILIGEAVTRHKSGVLIESQARERLRLGEWVDTLRG